jgi:hypothetical protein
LLFCAWLRCKLRRKSRGGESFRETRITQFADPCRSQLSRILQAFLLPIFTPCCADKHSGWEEGLHSGPRPLAPSNSTPRKWLSLPPWPVRPKQLQQQLRIVVKPTRCSTNNGFSAITLQSQTHLTFHSDPQMSPLLPLPTLSPFHPAKHANSCITLPAGPRSTIRPLIQYSMVLHEYTYAHPVRTSPFPLPLSFHISIPLGHLLTVGSAVGAKRDYCN